MVFSMTLSMTFESFGGRVFDRQGVRHDQQIRAGQSFVIKPLRRANFQR
jgi:hypothetical protein